MIEAAPTTAKPPAIRITAWREGRLVRKTALMTENGLRNVLLNAMDHDEAHVDLIFHSIENIGFYRVVDADFEEEFLLEKLLHS